MNDLYEICEELEEAAKLDCSELGEWWERLVALYPRIDGGSEEFQAAYEKEIRSEYKRFKEEFRIVEETVTKTVTYRELRHVSE